LRVCELVQVLHRVIVNFRAISYSAPGAYLADLGAKWL